MDSERIREYIERNIGIIDGIGARKDLESCAEMLITSEKGKLGILSAENIYELVSTNLRNVINKLEEISRGIWKCRGDKKQMIDSQIAFWELKEIYQEYNRKAEEISDKSNRVSNYDSSK